MKTPTIYEIKRDYQEHNPNGHYFDRDTMRWFGQTLRDFHVNKTEKEGVFFIWADSYAIFGQYQGRKMGTSKRYYSMNTHRMADDINEL